MKILIGIPAYNEEENIAHIIKQLVFQINNHTSIFSFCVVSEGNDATGSIVKKLAEKSSVPIELIKKNQRKGVSDSINILLFEAEKNNADFLVMIDADTSVSENFISELLNICSNQHEESCVIWIEYVYKKPVSYLQKIIKVGRDIVRDIRKKQRFYNAIGRCVILSKQNFHSLKIPIEVIGGDMYVFLWAKYTNIKTVFCEKLYVEEVLPNNIDDFKKQNQRFIESLIQIKKYFPEKHVIYYSKIPFFILLRGVLYSFVKSPLKTIFYIILNRISALDKNQKQGNLWNRVSSTKKQ